MTVKINRWLILAASTLVLLCTGAIYAFSVLAGPLSAAKGWSLPDIMIAFTINSAVAPIPMILGGYFTDKGWAKWSITIGGLMFGLGFFLSGLATSTGMLYLTYGLLAGLGQGLAYSGCLSNTIKLFPDKKGLASGIITAGMGGAAIIAAPIANALIESHDVMYAFRVLGIAYIIIVAIASFCIKSAPKNFVPEGWQNTEDGHPTETVANKNWTAMLKTPIFYVIFLMLFTGAFSGLMIASNASVIGQQMFKLSAVAAAGYVSIYSLCNCLGRIIWGSVSDKIGRTNTLYVIFIVIILAFIALVSLSSVAGFAVGIIALGLCFGGVMGVFPPMVMENFGPVNQGVNYGIVFIGYSLAAFFGPKTAGSIAASSGGSYAQAFYVAIGIAIVGLVLNFVYPRMMRKRA
ncbi:L-lactate MFS transporter [Secundilactobacillus folii]|uniref:MFS transporter n=1 Tax=Secundilactobacillus folii TaxID=2678357 RepID=A0A7X3C2B2_9LACO|nr:OFA family MFS transporter [Secundilactobacillus folii]MTV82665.1 MFS transporter [Secundilactobacillus folii]